MPAITSVSTSPGTVSTGAGVSVNLALTSECSKLPVASSTIVVVATPSDRTALTIATGIVHRLTDDP